MKEDTFAVYDVVRGKEIRSRQFVATNGPLVRIDEMEVCKAEEVLLQIGGGPIAGIDRMRAAAIIEILAWWLASGCLWIEDNEA